MIRFHLFAKLMFREEINVLFDIIKTPLFAIFTRKNGVNLRSEQYIDKLS